MKHSLYNKQDIMPGVNGVDLQGISFCKDLFFQNVQGQDIFSSLEPEIAASWQRSKKFKVDPQMQELPYILKPPELRTLVQDKKKFINLAKSYFCTLLPLLNLPKTALVIQNQDGTILELWDPNQLLRLKLTAGSICGEETVGTSSTSLCIESGKIVQLIGPRHYCKALEEHLATTAPIIETHGNLLGLITIVHQITEELLNKETLQRILLWVVNLKLILESQLELSERSYWLSSSVPFVQKGKCVPPKKDIKTPFSNILGDSPQIHTILQTAMRFAKTDNGILLTGESGTGKEMFAQAIHQASGRSGSFIAINCAALPSNLIASELFGYVSGAFTGAEQKGRMGKIELAKDGTLFLDEIGDMPLEIQPAFLRVLENKKITRLGSNKDIYVDFRLIAATNADIFQLVQEKKFRADLYYRLETLLLELPPLRERGHDILLIANNFLEEICMKNGQAPLKLNKDTELFMLNYAWPGNIRQLKNAMLYAANACQGQVIEPQDLPASMYKNSDMPLPGKDFKNYEVLSLQETEQRLIRKALLKTGNNVCDAAKMLGLSKTSVYRKIKEYNINI